MKLRFAKANRQVSDKSNNAIHIEQFYILNKTCMDVACPHSTPLCEKYCFGNCVFRHSNRGKKKLSTEIIAEENYKISTEESFIHLMSDLKKYKKGNSPLYVRIHSIGEFYNFDYFQKWITIIKENSDVHFTAYIKSFDILHQYIQSKQPIPQTLNVLLSVFPDTYSSYSDGKVILKKDVQATKQLIKYLQKQYNAIQYIVCGKEYFIDLLKKRIDLHKSNPKRSKNILFCDAGMKLFRNEEHKIIIEKAEALGLINPNASCSNCKMCYIPSNETQEIYAVLRASSQLANIKKFQNNPNYKYV